MKKISRRSFLTAMAAVSAAGVLAACGASSSTASSVASSVAASSEAAASSAAAQESIIASTGQERAGPFLPFSLHRPPERAILEQKNNQGCTKARKRP